SLIVAHQIGDVHVVRLRSLIGYIDRGGGRQRAAEPVINRVLEVVRAGEITGGRVDEGAIGRNRYRAISWTLSVGQPRSEMVAVRVACPRQQALSRRYGERLAMGDRVGWIARERWRIVGQGDRRRGGCRASEAITDDETEAVCACETVAGVVHKRPVGIHANRAVRWRLAIVEQGREWVAVRV